MEYNFIKNNNLPTSWCVKNDGSQLFKDTVIAYLNTCNRCQNPPFTGSCSEYYYGVTKTGIGYFSTYTREFDTVLSLSEFINLTNTPGLHYGDLVEVSYDNINWHKRIYVATRLIDSTMKCLCIDAGQEDRVDTGVFRIALWTYVRPIQKSKPAIDVSSDEMFDIVAKAKGVDKSQIKIVE